MVSLIAATLLCKYSSSEPDRKFICQKNMTNRAAPKFCCKPLALTDLSFHVADPLAVCYVTNALLLVHSGRCCPAGSNPCSTHDIISPSLWMPISLWLRNESSVLRGWRMWHVLSGWASRCEWNTEYDQVFNECGFCTCFLSLTQQHTLLWACSHCLLS